MAHLLIWGDTREILAGGAPPGTPVEEIRSLAALQSLLEGRVAGAMVLADPRCLEAEREPIETWLRNGGAAQGFLVAVTDLGEGDDVLSRLPFLDDVLARPVTPVLLLRRLERGMDVIRNRRVIRQLNEKLTQRGEELSKLNDIGVKLSAERDIDKLLELILQKSREITGADAGSLYLVQRAQDKDPETTDRLIFELAQNDTVNLSFKKNWMALDTSSIAGYVALTGKPVNEPDAYNLREGTPYTISRSFDEKSGYRSKSMLVVPMRDHDEVVIGVIQLINKKRNRLAVLSPATIVEDEVITFTSEDETLARSLASQAAVAFENADLIRRIRTLFDQFIRQAVWAVELRDPTTAGHSERVALLTVDLVEKVDAVTLGPLADHRFTRDEVEQLRYAALLHDFGKVGVQEKFLKKGKKLFATQKIAIRQRFAYVLEAIETDHLRAKLRALESGRADAGELAAMDAEHARRRAKADGVLRAVLAANEPKLVEEQSFSALMNLPARRFENHKEEDEFPVEAWADGPFLSEDEVEALSIRRGSLSGDERKAIESHVQKTYEFLAKMPWTPDLRRVPDIAWAHHEKLDGSGYPRGRRGPDQIPIESRMMTIADIFDALVAWDRPYKESVPVETALEILHDETRAGKLDEDLLRVFVEAKLYDLPEYWERPEMKGRRKSRT